MYMLLKYLKQLHGLLRTLKEQLDNFISAE